LWRPEVEIQAIPSAQTLGAEIPDIDLSRRLNPQEVDGIYQAILDHCVIYFRNQDLTQQQLVDFTNNFGVAIEHVRKQLEREVKEVFIVSNVKENGQEIGALGNAELTFHSDLSYMPKPGTLSMLYAREIPSTGGETTWCDCREAYDALSEEDKAEIGGLRAVHRHYVEAQNPPEIVDHPVVIRHPDTGRKSLYVGPHLTKHLVDVDPGDSERILGKLYAHLSNPDYHWTHDWRVDDVVVWDNRPTMHRREPFPEQERRLMWRTQIFNDVAPQP
jgi:taurine dioxygenase